MSYREYIVFFQDRLKEFNPTKFNRVMISYFACFELVFMVFIIGEIFHQSYLIRGKVLQKSKYPLLSIAASAESGGNDTSNDLQTPTTVGSRFQKKFHVNTSSSYRN